MSYVIATIWGASLPIWLVIIGCLLLAALSVPTWIGDFYEEWKYEREVREARDRELRSQLMRAAKNATKKAVEKTLIKARLKSPDTSCPFCREAVDEETSCGSCGTPFHGDCLSELGRGRCPTIGCRKRSSLRS